MGEGKIDAWSSAACARPGIEPARPCSDAVFLRRVFLDVIGTLPEPPKCGRFCGQPAGQARGADRRPARARRIRRLLVDEVVRPAAGEGRVSDQPVAQRGAGLSPLDPRRRSRTNMPYDRFARELLTSSGSNFRVPQVNFFRAVQGREPPAIAAAVALTFMGSAHREVAGGPAGGHGGILLAGGLQADGRVEGGDRLPRSRARRDRCEAVLAGWRKVTVAPRADPREVFADWLVAPRIRWFARAAVNRCGRG